MNKVCKIIIIIIEINKTGFFWFKFSTQILSLLCFLRRKKQPKDRHELNQMMVFGMVMKKNSGIENDEMKKKQMIKYSFA